MELFIVRVVLGCFHTDPDLLVAGHELLPLVPALLGIAREVALVQVSRDLVP